MRSRQSLNLQPNAPTIAEPIADAPNLDFHAPSRQHLRDGIASLVASLKGEIVARGVLTREEPTFQTARTILEKLGLVGNSRQSTATGSITQEDILALARSIGVSNALVQNRAETRPFEQVAAQFQPLLASAQKILSDKVIAEAFDEFNRSGTKLDFDSRTSSVYGILRGHRVETVDIEKWGARVDELADNILERVRFFSREQKLEAQKFIKQLDVFCQSATAACQVYDRLEPFVRNLKKIDQNVTEAIEAIPATILGGILNLIAQTGSSSSGPELLFIYCCAEVVASQDAIAYLQKVPINNFRTMLDDFAFSDDHPRVAVELERASARWNMILSSEPSQSHRPSGITLSQSEQEQKVREVLKEAGVCEQERMAELSSSILRKIPYNVFRERLAGLKRVCRLGENSWHGLIASDARLLIDPDFDEYLSSLRKLLTAIQANSSHGKNVGLSLAKNPEKFLPEAITDTFEAFATQYFKSQRNGHQESPASGAAAAAEHELREKLGAAGFNSGVTLALVKYGFSRRGTVFAGHRTVARERVTEFTAHKLKVPDHKLIAESFDKLKSAGAIVQYPSRGCSLVLNPSSIKDAAVRDLVSYCLTFWMTAALR